MRLAEYQLVLQCELCIRAEFLVALCKLVCAVVLDEVYACDVELRVLDRNCLVDLLQSEAGPLCEELCVLRCDLESEVLLNVYECEERSAEADIVYDLLALMIPFFIAALGCIIVSGN